MGKNREKSNIAIAILEKLPFLKANIISHFDGSNNIFTDCMSYDIVNVKLKINLDKI